MIDPGEAFSSGSFHRRMRVASTAGALLGFGLGILIARSIPMSARPSQLPGFAAAHGFDPRGYLLRLLLLGICPLAGALIATAPVKIARRSRSSRRRTEAPELAPARWHGRKSPFAVTRRVELFVPAAAAHAITAWIFLVVPLAARGVSPVLLLPTLFLVSAALAALLGGRDLDSGASFLSCAAVVFPLAFWGGRPPAIDWALGAAVFLLPPLARGVFGRRERGGNLLRALTVTILLPGSITALAASAMMNGPPVADVFEDGHGLLPASEYLRGELPYRDVIPGHGLLSDGLLAAGELRLFGDDYGGLRRAQKLNGLLFWPAFYAIGCAATGSAAVGFGGLLLSFLCFPMYLFLRVMASLWVLALAIHACRVGERWAWFATGALVPIALCVSVEFAAYAGGSALVALWVARGPRLRHLRGFALGVLASGSAIAVALALAGILSGFVRTTFLYLPSLLPAYGIALVRPALPRSAALATWAAFLGDRTLLLYAFVALSIIVVGALLPRAPAVGARARPMLPVLAWVALAMVSVAERRHVGYPFFLVPLGLLLMTRWFRGARPWGSPRGLAAVAALALFVVLARPWRLAEGMAAGIANPSPPPGFVALEEPARGRGAFVSGTDAALVRATAELIREARFSRGDTWLDFANAPGLYYLFDRDCPIRYYEVPFFESEDAQAEVIAAVEHSPRVRAVLIASGLPSDPIDGVPNAVRAPRVAKLVQARFHPFLRRGGVEFWLRGERPDPALTPSSEAATDSAGPAR